MGEERKEVRKPTLFTAVLPLIFMFVVLFTGLVVYSIDIKILLIICAAFTICVCMYQGHKWKEIEDEIVAKLAKAFPAIMILICVGLMIGAWVVSGTIPFLVYIGLQIISPKYIIITSFLVTVILSVSTGTSWGAAGTVGELQGAAAESQRSVDECTDIVERCKERAGTVESLLTRIEGRNRSNGKD